MLDMVTCAQDARSLAYSRFSLCSRPEISVLGLGFEMITWAQDARLLASSRALQQAWGSGCEGLGS